MAVEVVPLLEATAREDDAGAAVKPGAEFAADVEVDTLVAAVDASGCEDAAVLAGIEKLGKGLVVEAAAVLVALKPEKSPPVVAVGAAAVVAVTLKGGSAVVVLAAEAEAAAAEEEAVVTPLAVAKEAGAEAVLVTPKPENAEAELVTPKPENEPTVAGAEVEAVGVLVVVVGAEDKLKVGKDGLLAAGKKGDEEAAAAPEAVVAVAVVEAAEAKPNPVEA